MGGDDLAFTVGTNQALINVDEKTTLMIRHSDSNYPDYKAAMPEPVNTVKITKLQAMKVLKQANLLSDSTIQGVKLAFNGHIDVLMLHPEHGTYQREGAIEFEGEPFEEVIEVGFNVKYLLDAFGTLEKDESQAYIGVKDKETPMVIGHQDFNAVVMPMRI